MYKPEEVPTLWCLFHIVVWHRAPQADLKLILAIIFRNPTVDLCV